MSKCELTPFGLVRVGDLKEEESPGSSSESAKKIFGESCEELWCGLEQRQKSAGDLDAIAEKVRLLSENPWSLR